jgi:hypothetical protein
MKCRTKRTWRRELLTPELGRSAVLLHVDQVHAQSVLAAG